MRIVCAIPSLEGGGAEAVLVRLARHWAEQGQTVTIVTLDAGQPGHAPATEDVTAGNVAAEQACRQAGVHLLPLDVMRDSAGLWSAVTSNWRRVALLRAAFRRLRPRVIVSFLDQVNVLTLLAAAGQPWPVLVSERIHPGYHPLPKAWRALRRLVYRWATRLVVQTPSIAAYCRRYVSPRRLIVIPNGVDLAAAPDWSLTAGELGRPVRIVAAGRLAPQKGFDWLLQAAEQLNTRCTNWLLEIYGEGPERDNLERQRSTLHCAERIRLPGWQMSPLWQTGPVDMVVLPSRYEGFPNVLLEALAAGIPVVAMNCPGGPADLVHSGEEGWLVPVGDVAALSDRLAQLVEDPQLRQTMARAARRSAARFAVEHVFAQWDALLDEVTVG